MNESMERTFSVGPVELIKALRIHVLPGFIPLEETHFDIWAASLEVAMFALTIFVQKSALLIEGFFLTKKRQID